MRPFMDSQGLLNKLRQIEEHAQLTLEEFPNLTSERQRMIIALCRFIATEMEISSEPAANSDNRTHMGATF